MASCTDCGVTQVASGPNAGAFAIKNAGRSGPWASACVVENGNGLYCDPLTGNAWVHPPVSAGGIDSVFGPNYTGNVVAGAISPTRSTTFTNPSACNDFVATLGHSFGFGITHDAPFEVEMRFHASWAVNAPAPAPSPQSSETIVGAATAIRTIWSQHVEFNWFSPVVVPAGGYIEVKHFLEVIAVRFFAATPPTWHPNGSQSVLKIYGTNKQV